MPQNDFNVWCKWDPLKKALVGSCVNANYFEHVENRVIREKLTKMLIETQQDLDYFAQVLQQHGVEVIRNCPNRGKKARLDPDSKTPLQISPKIQMFPRDHFSTIGNHLIVMDKNPLNLFDTYPEISQAGKKHSKAWLELHAIYLINDYHLPSLPSWTLVGKDLFLDMDLDPWVDQTLGDSAVASLKKWAEKWWPQIDIHWLKIGAHNDGCFHTCKPGAIISLHEVQKYSDTFPNWDILYLPDQSWHAVEDFIKAKKLTKGKYWIPGEADNTELLTFINRWLDDWVGYVEETVFDVNILMINDKTACVSNYNKDVFAFFKKHKIEPIIVPLRHRYFWDGGLHCSSLDLYREGECQSYINYN